MTPDGGIGHLQLATDFPTHNLRERLVHIMESYARGRPSANSYWSMETA
jgi:hypothetical protein